MSLVRIDWNPDVRQRRKFGVAMLIGFGLISAVLYLKHYALASYWCAGFGLLSGLLGLTGSRAVLPFYWLWMGIAFVMGNVMSRLILGVFYYALFTPIALAMRLSGRDKLEITKSKKKASYWNDVASSQNHDYERQF